MSGIVAGVVLKFEYSMPGQANVYSGYLDYEDKEIAKQSQSLAYASYPTYYMDNPDKTTGLFTKDKDMLNEQDIEKFKILYDTAQENGSPMWRPIISFDNRWLTQMGIYDPDTQLVNVKELETATRKCINSMLENEKMEGVVWTAAVHHNTDNIHIHVSMVQPIPMRDWEKESPKFKVKSFERGKSSVVNYMMENQKEFSMIQELSRNKIIGQGYNTIIRDQELKERLEKLYDKLPDDHRLWKYNMNAMQPYREEIDKITSIYLERYCKDDYQVLKGMLIIQQQKYEQAYGSQNDYAQNQIDDLYVRMGNVILREGKEYVNAKSDSTEDSNNDIINRKFVNTSKDKNMQIRSYSYQKNSGNINQIMSSLKNACNDMVQKKLNRQKYHELENAIEYGKDE